MRVSVYLEKKLIYVHTLFAIRSCQYDATTTTLEYTPLLVALDVGSLFIRRTRRVALLVRRSIALSVVYFSEG